MHDDEANSGKGARPGERSYYAASSREKFGRNDDTRVTKNTGSDMAVVTSVSQGKARVHPEQSVM